MRFKTEAQGGTLKPSGYKIEYTLEQAQEVLVACPNDPIHFIEKYCWIVNPENGRVRFKLYDYQKDLIRHYSENRKTVSLISRQAGKTETAAAFLLWWACFKNDQRILITSYKGDSAKAILRRLKEMYKNLPWFIKPGIEPDGWNQLSLRFDNGSTVECETTTSNTGRGLPIALLYVDELAYVRPTVAADFWTSVLPTISAGGRIIITSTANTDEDKFAQIWLNAKISPYSDKWIDGALNRQVVEEAPEDYETIYENEDLRAFIEQTEAAKDKTIQGFVGFHAKWYRVPGRDEVWKKSILASGTKQSEWDRDYECSFLTKDETLISAPKLLALNVSVCMPKFVDKWGGRWYEEIKPNTAYGVVLDPSEGVDKNDACIQVFEIPALRQVFEWNSNTADQAEQAKMLNRTLHRIYNIQQDDPEHDGTVNIYYSVESNGLGVGVLRAIEDYGEEKFPGWLLDTDSQKRRGLWTSSATKKRFAVEFADLIERNLMTIRSKRLLSEMKTFVKRGQSWAAKQGSQDDLVMACILMVQLLDEIRNHEPDLDERITVDIENYDPDDPYHPDNIALVPMLG